jgi:transposase
MSDTTRTAEDILPARLCMALDLGASKWHVAFLRDTTRRPKVHVIVAGNFGTLLEKAAAAKKRLGLPADAPISSCYEAGRDGFWIHRELVKRGVDNHVIDPASIEVERRWRKRKTDGIDATKEVVRLVRFVGGDKHAFRTVNVPDEAAEDARRVTRERRRLKKEAAQHQTRIRALLATIGVREERVMVPSLRADGQPLPPLLRAELDREMERLKLVREHLRAVEGHIKAYVETSSDATAEKCRMLSGLKGIGVRSAAALCLEFFGWRQLRNRRQVGGLAGLTGTPHQSGDINREQGISKAGNSSIRTLMVELAWGWLRYQPNSDLSRWFAQRFGGGKSRQRRIGVVALARKLLVALWRFVDQGVVPTGALLTPMPRLS